MTPTATPKPPAPSKPAVDPGNTRATLSLEGDRHEPAAGDAEHELALRLEMRW